MQRTPAPAWSRGVGRGIGTVRMPLREPHMRRDALGRRTAPPALADPIRLSTARATHDPVAMLPPPARERILGLFRRRDLAFQIEQWTGMLRRIALALVDRLSAGLALAADDIALADLPHQPPAGILAEVTVDRARRLVDRALAFELKQRARDRPPAARWRQRKERLLGADQFVGDLLDRLDGEVVERRVIELEQDRIRAFLLRRQECHF